MTGQMATAIALPGLNDLGRSVTSCFLLMDYFLYRFSTLSEKMVLSIKTPTCYKRTPNLHKSWHVNDLISQIAGK